ncbi:hypothetical protein HWV62_7461 [Athelia sp. TMB]|nr:hypothetical protein HWV62_7461 [Athelia sp. TMB]
MASDSTNKRDSDGTAETSESKRVQIHAGGGNGGDLHWQLTPPTADTPPTYKAWEVDYKGNHAKVLLRTITNLFGSNEHAPYLVIVQSSGAGKSRCVYELGASLPLISLNLREYSGSETSGFPARDTKICRLLHRGADESSRDDKRRLCAAFLAGVLEAALSIILENNLTDLDPSDWRGLLDQNKQSFDERAAKRANELWEELSPDHEVIILYVLPATQKLSSCFKDAPHILLGIDEYHTLNFRYTTSKGSDEYTTYNALCDVLHYLRREKIFVIFMSTTFKLGRLAPSIGEQHIKQHAPYVSLPFDLYDGGPIITEDELTLTDVCNTEFLCRFGRPLWYTRWKCGDTGVKRRIIDFAMLKLNTFASLQRISNGAKFAALSIRLLLTFEPDRHAPSVSTETYQEALGEELDQVASHMRVVHSVPEHCEYMRTGTPSEPILAEAAGQLLMREDQVKCLAEALNPLVGTGEPGKLAARLLFNLAHDATILGLESNGFENPIYARPIPFLDFFKNLFADQWSEAILDSTPVGGDSTPFKDAFTDCYVHFTHWAKIGDESCITTEALWKGLARGIAWQCCGNMLGIDLVIPMLVGKESKLGCDTVTALFVKIRDKSKAQIVTLRKDFASTLFQSGTHHPLVFLTMQLGVKLSEAKPLQETTAQTAIHQGRDSQNDSKDANITPAAGGGSLPLSRTSNHNRYDISAIGCSSRIYRAVKDEDKVHWRHILASQKLNDEHPYKGPGHLDLLLQSKPFFSKSSFGWGGNKADADKMITDQNTPGPDPEMVEETVAIGGV